MAAGRTHGQVYEASISVDAPPERVWEVWSDIERWPAWTASVTAVERLDGPGPLRVGSRVRIRQPRLPVAVWTVTELVEGQRLAWTSSAPGVRTVATHVVEREGTGSRATARIEQGGLLSGVVRLLMGGLVERYLVLESAGLKARSEE
jgi:uncharacterized membrane protein